MNQNCLRQVGELTWSERNYEPVRLTLLSHSIWTPRLTVAPIFPVRSVGLALSRLVVSHIILRVGPVLTLKSWNATASTALFNSLIRMALCARSRSGGTRNRIRPTPLPTVPGMVTVGRVTYAKRGSILEKRCNRMLTRPCIRRRCTIVSSAAVQRSSTPWLVCLTTWRVNRVDLCGSRGFSRFIIGWTMLSWTAGWSQDSSSFFFLSICLERSLSRITLSCCIAKSVMVDWGFPRVVRKLSGYAVSFYTNCVKHLHNAPRFVHWGTLQFSLF